MATTEFIAKFAEALEIEDASNISAATEFRSLEEWDSLAYLSVIAMLDEEYEVQIENAVFKQLQTIGDIVKYIEENK